MVTPTRTSIVLPKYTNKISSTRLRASIIPTTTISRPNIVYTTTTTTPVTILSLPNTYTARRIPYTNKPISNVLRLPGNYSN